MALDKDKQILGSQERTCPECGRQFIITSQWAYRLIVKHHTSWYCRYNCVRAAERKLKEANGRMKELKSKKPLKEVLEADLRAGLPLLKIAKKYDASVASVHNWIKSYGLAGIQGKPKTDEIIQQAPPAEMVQQSPTADEVEQFHVETDVQEIPVEENRVPGCFSEYNPEIYWCNDCKDKEECLTTFNKLNPQLQGMTEEENMSDKEWESKAPEEDQVKQDAPVPRETCGEIWQDITSDLITLQEMYIEEADKAFRAELVQLILAVTKGRGLFG